MRYQRHQKGSSLVEVIVLMVLVLAVFSIASDLFWILIGFSTNNNLCARASRAASQGAPDRLKRGEPYRRVMSVISESQNSTGPLEMSRDVSISEQLKEPLPDPVFGGPVNGEVNVTTTMRIHPPFLLSRFFGPQGLALRASKTYPFSYMSRPQ